jgi:hypothetical protein
MPLAGCLQESNLENELVDAALRKDFSHTSRTQRTLATNTIGISAANLFHTCSRLL